MNSRNDDKFSPTLTEQFCNWTVAVFRSAPASASPRLRFQPTFRSVRTRVLSSCRHSAHIAPGRTGLFELVRALPETARYENRLIVAEGDYVMAHGRFSGSGRPRAWIAADILRIANGRLAEHWDVLQDEATAAESVSGLPMFGDQFAT